ncbi:MAG TPA: hypothetical protein VF279_05085, partial [Acidimicrobiales bacterium]
MTDDEHPTTPDAPADEPGAGAPTTRDVVPPAPEGGFGNAFGPPSGPVPPPGPPPVADERIPAGPISPMAPFRPEPKRRSRLRWVIWGVVGVLVLAGAIASQINLAYYAIQPGTAQSVQPFITVPPGKAHRVVDPVLLTDVREARVTALSYLVFKLQSNTSLYPLPDVTGGTAPSEL